MKKNTKKNNPWSNHNPTITKKNSTKRSAIKKNRAIHKKLALHPFNVFFMLCLGVILVVSTINALADSYTVSAIVPHPPAPSSPATITSPTNGQRFSSRVITVSGTCPTDPHSRLYVALFTNDIWTGYSTCTRNTYQISTIIYNGFNTLQVRDFDYYNTPGTLLSPITVFYSAPATPQSNISLSVVPPIAISVLQEDTNVPFISPNIVQEVSDQPTLTGIAPPFSRVMLTIHSNPVICLTTANSQGFWSCRVNQILPLGLHYVYVQATTTLGAVINFQTFKFVTVNKVAIPANLTKGNFIIATNFKSTEYFINQPVSFTLDIKGGVAPFAFNIDWGDGLTTEVTRLNNDSFSINHTYTKTNALMDNKIIKIEGIDSRGDVSSLQLFASIKNPAYTNFISYISESTGLSSVFSGIKSWLWIIWPGYIIIMLMIISFWLGERQELISLIKKRSRNTKLAVKR